MRPLALALVLIAAPAAGAQDVSARLDDLRLATAVRLALSEDPATARVAAAVRARGGAVALDADWPSADVQARAEAVARGVRGVASVAFGDAPPPPAVALDVSADEPREAGETAEDEGIAEAPPSPEPRTRNVEPPPPAEAPVRPLEPAPVAEPAPEPVRGGWHAPPASDPPPAPDDGAVYHTVLLGDTLYSIARRYDTTVEALQALNGLGDSTGLALGQRLRVR